MRSLVLLLCVLLLLAGCAGVADGDVIADGVESADVELGDIAEPVFSGAVVTDGARNVHQIPENRETVTLASAYAVAVPFITALELSDRVVAINVKSRFWTDADDGLAAAGTVGRGVLDLEALAEFAPDVLIHRADDAATIEAVTDKLGIPVLGITAEDFDDIIDTLTMMGEYFGVEERAREVCDWLRGKFDIIDEIVARIPQDQRVTAIVMGGEPYRVAGGDMLQSWMIEKAGGISAVSNLSDDRTWADIGTETVFEIDPDFIFCTSSTVLNYNVEHLLTDSTWSAMAAVISETIHVIPSAIDSWDMPGISAALATMYMLHKMYPDYFSTEQLQREIDEYYIFMFGKTFDRAYLGYSLER